jgi:hypothetical protein
MLYIFGENYMTDTQLLGFIRTQLSEEGVTWESEKELFDMLVPDEDWAKYKTNWDNWKHQRVSNLNRSPNIRTAISQTLKFSPDIWNKHTDIEQKRILRECIKKFVTPGKNIDLSSLIPKAHPITENQENLIQKVIDVHRKDEINLLNEHLDYFNPIFETQSFLLKLIPVLYDQGHYDFLHTHTFPALLTHHQADTQIKILMAHTLGSLTEPKHLEAAKLLDVIPAEKDAHIIDMKTAAISNVRRFELHKPDLSKEKLAEILDVLIQYYHDTFTTNEIHHYYPGINLAYVLCQHNTIFPEREHNCPLSIQEIYQHSKTSIEKELKNQDKESQYYAKISELEFKLLLNHSNIEPELYVLLEEIQSPYATVERTIRQMELFIALHTKLSTKNDKLIQNFEQFVNILKDYLEHSKH